MAEIPEVYNKVEQESPDIKMLEGLVCPISHCALHYDKKLSELKNLRDQLSYLAKNCHGDNKPDCPILDALAKKSLKL